MQDQKVLKNIEQNLQIIMQTTISMFLQLILLQQQVVLKRYFLLLEVLLDPVDDEVIIPEPFYANYNGFSAASGVNVVPVISGIEDNFALPPIEEFREINFSAKTKAILICNPGNPTGYIYSQKKKFKN